MLADDTLRALGKYAELYERAASFPGRPRERMVALGEADELFFRLFPQHYRGLQVVRVASQLTQAPPPREHSNACENRVVGLLNEIVFAAVAAGDLAIPPPRRVDELAFTIWSLAFGVRALMTSSIAVRQLRINDAAGVLRESIDLMLDAVNWQPLSRDWDYEKTRRRVREEWLAEEWLGTSLGP